MEQMNNSKPLYRGASLKIMLIAVIGAVTLCTAAEAQSKPRSPLRGIEIDTRGEKFLFNKRLVPHRKNYLLFYSYDQSLRNRPSPTPGGTNQEGEVKFQLSLKYPLSDTSQQNPDGYYIAYTGLSFWQLWDPKDSSPFRTTDHEPEFFWERDYDPGCFTRVGIVHQSNGESGIDNRSWNRAYVEGRYSPSALDRGEPKSWGATLKLWDVFSEADENEDISEYMGPFELRAEYFFAGESEAHVSAMLRNSLWDGDHNRGAFRLEYAFTFQKNFRFLFQYFNGYGESLLDFRTNANRFSVGVELSS